MEFLTIIRGQHDKLSPHFEESEFYSNSSDAPASHPLADVLVQAAEFLRSHFNTPWRITSTFRTEADERHILKERNKAFFISQHMKGKAFDSQPVNRDPEIMKALWLDLTSSGPIYQKLREIGITGFGIYNTFLHLDCRDSEFKQHRSDKYGPVARWDSRTGPARLVGNFSGVAPATSQASTTVNRPPAPKPSSSPWLVRRQPGADCCSR